MHDNVVVSAAGPCSARTVVLCPGLRLAERVDYRLDLLSSGLSVRGLALVTEFASWSGGFKRERQHHPRLGWGKLGLASALLGR